MRAVGNGGPSGGTMLIASRFKRPTAPVNLSKEGGGSTDYFFKPIDPNSPDSEHVADVTNTEHISRLLAIPEGYYIAEAEAITRSVASAAAAGTLRPVAVAAAAAPVAVVATAAAPPVVAPVAVETESPAIPVASEEVVATAAALISLQSLKAFKEAIGKVSDAVLQAALDQESAKGDDERATYTKALRAQLKK
jgi:hypothetical protein